MDALRECLGHIAQRPIELVLVRVDQGHARSPVGKRSRAERDGSGNKQKKELTLHVVEVPQTLKHAVLAFEQVPIFGRCQQLDRDELRRRVIPSRAVHITLVAATQKPFDQVPAIPERE
jgi:hypothetical protein